MWNNLPEHVMDLKSVIAFKINLEHQCNNIEIKFNPKR